MTKLKVPPPNYLSIIDTLHRAAQGVCAGGVIAYPTEAVYGLGCDPWSQSAVERVLALKCRSVEKGLIVIGASLDQLDALTKLSIMELTRVLNNSGERPTSWIVPASAKAPPWITGGRSTVVLRLVGYSLIRSLCEIVNGPLVSTSANRAGAPPATNADEVRAVFPEGIDVLIDAPTGGERAPSLIRDWQSGEIARD